MPPLGSLEAASGNSVLDCASTENCGSKGEVSSLNTLALRSLVSLFNEKEGLFSRSVALTQDGLHREKASPKRTIIALLGLHRLRESGEPLPFDLSSMRDALLGDTSWVRTLGELGLLNWFTAECAPERLGNLFNEFSFGSAIGEYWDGRQAQTTGLAWFLAGIAHTQLARPQLVPDLIDVAANAYRLLEDNQSESGIFGHAAHPGFLQRTFCKRFGTFGDQIHAIYAPCDLCQSFSN